MTVKELIEQLSILPQDLQVILQKDAEGNGYSPLSGVDSECQYVPDNTWSGEVYSVGEVLHEPHFEDCVVLFPIN